MGWVKINFVNVVQIKPFFNGKKSEKDNKFFYIKYV